MQTHVIEQKRENLHGTFCRDTPPVLKIDPGDSVECSLLDGDWHLKKPPLPQTGTGDFFEPRSPHTDWGHAMIGPIFIKGAHPGSVLAVRIEEARPASWGWSRVGGVDSDHTRRLGIAQEEEFFLNWDLDPDKLTGTSHQGHRVRLSPFLGVLGVAPAEEGLHSTHPPRACGGNLDCKCLVPGTVLYLPVFCEGALLSVGDGHAVQGDGELGGTAIECPMERVRLTIWLEDSMGLTMPRARTPEGWVTFGFSESLTDASYQALLQMACLMEEQYGFTKKEALSLTSLVVDQRVTQIVNGVRGVHAILPYGAVQICKKE